MLSPFPFPLISQHSEVSDDDGVSYMYTVSSIARLANTLGADFAPYLPFVLPKLLETASKEVRGHRCV